MDVKGMEVLVAEDTPLAQRLLQEILHMMGVKSIQAATTGKAALEILKDHEIDLVILDWMMPEMNGIEVLQIMRTHEKLKDIPVIMLTGNSDYEDVRQAVEAGANGYIIKPFTVTTIEEAVRKLPDQI